MKKFDIRLPLNPVSNKIVTKFEKAVFSHALLIKSRGTLKTIPGCVHWHIICKGNKGTLEATFDKNRLCLWLCYHDNRYADWIDVAVKKIRKTFESC